MQRVYCPPYTAGAGHVTELRPRDLVFLSCFFLVLICIDDFKTGQTQEPGL
jgi:hypothetical protein